MAKPRTELTDKQAAQVEALAAYLSKQQIADYLGVSRPTFDAILERDDLVSLHYKKGKAKAIANVAQGLVKQAIEGNMTAAIFYLKTQAGWRETEPESGDNAAPTPVSINIEVKDGRKPESNDTSS